MKAETAKKKALEEYETFLTSDPLQGQYVLAAKSHTHSQEGSYADCLTLSAMVDVADLSKILDKIKCPRDSMYELGMPTVFYKRNHSEGYVEEQTDRIDDVEIHAFVVQRENPEGFWIPELRRDFVYFYSLFEKNEGTRVAFHDHQRRIDNVIMIEKEQDTTSLLVRKEYLLDYLSLRKKALLIGSCEIRSFPVEDSFEDLEKTYSRGDIRGSATISSLHEPQSKMIVKLETIKAITPPDSRLLGDFGAKRGIPNVTFKTSYGPVSAREALKTPRDFQKFFASTYFHSQVLRKYEDDQRYLIDDSGGVHYRSEWGIFRGMHRVGDDYLQVNRGDLAESVPPEELEYWMTLNVDPLSVEELERLRKVAPYQQVLKQAREMKECAEEVIMKACTGCGISRDLLLNKLLYVEREKEEQFLKILKKTLTPRDSRDIFLSRVN